MLSNLLHLNTGKPVPDDWQPLGRICRQLLGRLLPRACLLCAEPCDHEPLCKHCWTALPGLQTPRCHRCALPIPSTTPACLTTAMPIGMEESLRLPDAVPVPGYEQRAGSEPGSESKPESMPTPSQASLPSQGTTLIPSVSCQTPGRIGPDPCREDPARLPPRYYCRHCLPADSTLDRVVGATDYTNPLDRVFGALKFGQQLALARPLAEVLLHRLAQDDMLRTLARFDALVPVPLSGARLAERGFNQSLEIALALRSASPIPLPPLRNDWLQRIRHTRSQSSLDARTRHQNLRGAFRAAAGLHGKRLALIDDVMTTGSTLIEAARELKAAGAAEVIALVVARTPVPFEAR